MQKRHFRLLADELRIERDRFIEQHGEAAFNDMLSFIVRFCRYSNPRFKEELFRDRVDGTCGPNGGEIRYGDYLAERGELKGEQGEPVDYGQYLFEKTQNGGN